MTFFHSLKLKKINDKHNKYTTRFTALSNISPTVKKSTLISNSSFQKLCNVTSGYRLTKDEIGIELSW